MTTPENAVLAQIQRRTVREQPAGDGMVGASSPDSFVLNMATVADNLSPWGAAPKVRDQQLRAFWHTEPILASAVYAISIRNAAFRWTLEGPELTVAAVQDMLHRSELGDGWQAMITKVCVDLFTQDNGAFIEVIRQTDKADSPVIGLTHLDAFRCWRTANREYPVIYTDRKNIQHKLEPHQVLLITEFPTPVEKMNGMQYCAVTRVLRAAQLLRDISVLQREKVSGLAPTSVHLVGGVSSQAISDALAIHNQTQLEKGMTRYVIPAIIASLDPNAAVSSATLDLKNLPDGFDFEESMRWYINQLALGFGADYQDFAPLPGRNLGSSTQSMILHEKSRGRGPAFFMTKIEQLFNFHGIMPRNVTFRYDEPDIMADLDKAALETEVTNWVNDSVESTVLTPQAGRQILLDKGLISEELFNSLSDDGDLTTDVVADADVPIENKAAHRRRRKPKKDEDDDKKASHDEGEALATNVADFGETERLASEDKMADDVAVMLTATLNDFKRSIGVKSLNLFAHSRVLGRKQEDPEAVIGAAKFWDDFRARATVTMEPLVRSGMLLAVEQNVDLGLAIDFDLVNEQVLAQSRTFTNRWWEQLSTSTRKQLRTAIVNWQEAGLGKAGLPDLVDAITPTFGKTRAQVIATTEVTQIFDAGDLIAHKAAGIEIEEWQTARDSRVDDEICKPLDGQRFPIDAGPRPVKGTHIG